MKSTSPVESLSINIYIFKEEERKVEVLSGEIGNVWCTKRREEDSAKEKQERKLVRWDSKFSTFFPGKYQSQPVFRLLLSGHNSSSLLILSTESHPGIHRPPISCYSFLEPFLKIISFSLGPS